MAIATILVVGGFLRFFNLYSANILNSDSSMFVAGNLYFSLFIGAIIGLLGIFGLYLLVKELFGWQTGAIASFLMATSYAHLILSQSGLTYILVSTIFSWSFYFMWRGMRESNYWYFAIAGYLFGMSFYVSNLCFWFIPVVAILFLNYWSYLKTDFQYSKYEFARNNLLKGFVILFLITLFVSIPLIYTLWQNPSSVFFSSADSTFSQPRPFNSFVNSAINTLGVLSPTVIPLQTNDLSNIPPITWPISILFIIGFARELGHWLSRKHGHFATSHTFIIMSLIFLTLPAFFTITPPNAFIIMGTLPLIFIFASRGIWWIFEKLNHWQYLTHPEKHKLFHGRLAPHVIMALYVLLGALSFHELWQYFKLIN